MPAGRDERMEGEVGHVGLTAPHQVRQVTGEAAGNTPGRLGEAGIGQQSGRITEQHPV
ncbi:MAG TPA: hypothetical protein VFO01_05225 [Trebonia sp.]|nr:hypothetical protein [Trebonia sp.]